MLVAALSLPPLERCRVPHVIQVVFFLRVPPTFRRGRNLVRTFQKSCSGTRASFSPSSTLTRLHAFCSKPLSRTLCFFPRPNCTRREYAAGNPTIYLYVCCLFARLHRCKHELACGWAAFSEATIRRSPRANRVEQFPPPPAATTG